MSRLGITAQTPYADRKVFDSLVDIIRRMIERRDENDMGAELRRTGEVYLLLGILESARAQLGSNTLINKAIGIMETTYYTKLSVSDICRAVGLERAYFSTLFKSVTGVSPYAFLTKLRIEKAATLIRDGCSVAEAAESVGLAPVNFARQCRRVTGSSPGKLKNK